LRLSIIIPVYNVEEYIDRCLQNIFKQGISTNDYEVILVNDGSTDKSVEIANKHKKARPNIHIIHQENSGPGVARNTGIDNAKGDYIYFLDADDYLIENSLAMLLDCAEKEQLDLLGFETLRTHTFKPNTHNTFPKNISLDFVGLGTSYVAKYNHRNECWWYFINRKFLLHTGLRFPKKKQLLEDVLFTQKLLLKTPKMGYTLEKVHRYYLRSNSTMISKEPQHYYNLLWDYERVIYEFTPVIKKIEQDKTIVESQKVVKQLKSKQQSFVFFLIVRTLKYGMDFNEFKLLVNRLETHTLYPIKNIIYKNHGGKIKFISFIFNCKLLLFPISRLARVIAK